MGRGRTLGAIPEMGAIECPSEQLCKRGDIIFGSATVKAFKHGWALVGGRFTSKKRIAVNHAKQIHRLMMGD